MAGSRSESYKIKRSDRTLTGATSELEFSSQGNESTPRDFKLSSMTTEMGSVVGQLTQVEHN